MFSGGKKRYLGVFVSLLAAFGILGLVETLTMYPATDTCRGIITSVVSGWVSNETNAGIIARSDKEPKTTHAKDEIASVNIESKNQQNQQCSDSHWIFKQAWYNMGTRELLTTNHPSIKVENGKDIRLMDVTLQGISDVVILTWKTQPSPEDIVALVKKGLNSLKNDSNPNRALRIWIASMSKCVFYQA